MSRFSWRGPNVPPRQHEFETSLPEAKHHGRGYVTGERRPPARPPAPPRRHHRGFLDDLPLPERPIRPRRLELGEAFRAFARALGMGVRDVEEPAADVPAAGGGAPAGSFPVEAVGVGRTVTSAPAGIAA